MRKLLYICETDTGGIMEYAIRQVGALARLAARGESGVNSARQDFEVIFVCRPSFPVERLPAGLRVELLPEATLRDSGDRSGVFAKFARTVAMMRDLRRRAKRVAELVERERGSAQADKVCIVYACYKEYFAPLWSGPLRRLARKGVVIGTVAHDPVRDFAVGPRWWHRWSVRKGYSFVRDVFVHDSTPVDFGGPKPERIRVHEIPHGPYETSAPKLGRKAIRRRYGFAEDEADVVFLAFGQIRDGKNLDVFIRAMTQLPTNVKLLVAGAGVSGSSKPPEFYQQLACDLGVAERCAWDIRRVPDDEVGDIFAACDYVLLTYSAQFRSASGVLNTAVSARKLVLASSGAGPLKTVVGKYDLGVWVEPDSEAAVVTGVRSLLAKAPQADWDAYLRDNSWERNATRVKAAVGM